MLITESKLRHIIRSMLINEVDFVDNNTEEDESTRSFRMMWNDWLHTVFQGAEENFKPFVNSVYRSTAKRKKLESRWNILKNSPSQSQASAMFYNFLKEKFKLNNNTFKKEFIGDFFMENDIDPYDLFYDLRFFIKPIKNFSTWNRKKIPSLRASSPDFKFYIDENQWNKFSLSFENNKVNQSDFDFDNLENLSVGDMTSFGEVIKVDRSNEEV